MVLNCDLDLSLSPAMRCHEFPEHNVVFPDIVADFLDAR